MVSIKKSDRSHRSHSAYVRVKESQKAKIADRKTALKEIEKPEIRITDHATPKELKQNARNVLAQMAQVTDADLLLLEMKKYTGLLGQYSFWNSVLISLQNEDATIVRSKVEWNRFDRELKDGAKGMLVLYPIGAGKKVMPGEVKRFIEKKRKEGHSDEMIAEMVKEKYRKETTGTPYTFMVGKVYDISQTNQRAGTPVVPETEVIKAKTLYESIKEVAKKHYRVEEGPVENARGDTTYGSDHMQVIRVMKVPSEDKEALHTLIHEMSHAHLNHLKGLSEENRGIREVEAELSTYLVGEHYQMNFTKDSASYIKGWLGKSGNSLKQENLDRCMNNARWIINQVNLRVPTVKDAGESPETLKDKRMIALASYYNRSGHLTKKEFVRELAFKRNIVNQESAEKLPTEYVKKGLLKENKDGTYTPTFNEHAVIVPIDFGKHEEK